MDLQNVSGSVRVALEAAKSRKPFKSPPYQSSLNSIPRHMLRCTPGNFLSMSWKKTVLKGFIPSPTLFEKDSGRERLVWSGRWDLNPRQLAWEARTLPLSYARSLKRIVRGGSISSQETLRNYCCRNSTTANFRRPTFNR